MPENTEEIVANIPDGIEIERNGVSIPFVKTTVKRESKLGKGFPYLLPDKKWLLQGDNFDKFVVFYGMQKLVSDAIGKLKQRCQEAANEATNDDGAFNITEFVNDIKSLSARGESIPMLREKLEDLMSDMTALATAGLPATELETKFKALAEEVREVQEAINNKKRDTSKTKEAPALEAAAA